MGDGCILLHVDRKIKKIFIFATNLKPPQKKKKKRKKILGDIRYKTHNRQVDKPLNTYTLPKL